MVEVIRLGVPPLNDNIIRLGLPKKGRIKAKVSRLLTTTAVIEAGILGGLLGGVGGAKIGTSIITGLKTAGFTALGLGLVESSPKFVKFVGTKLADPTAGGRFIGQQIEKIGETPLPTEKTLKEKVKEGLGKAGILGGLVAGGIGGVALIKKAKEKVKDVKIPKVPDIRGIIPSGLAVSQLEQPIGAVKIAPVEKKPKVIEAMPMPTINNKISVNPEINISFKKSRKFINQQILMKQ